MNTILQEKINKIYFFEFGDSNFYTSLLISFCKFAFFVTRFFRKISMYNTKQIYLSLRTLYLFNL